MAVWELALVIFAVTYMVVNMVVVIYQIKMMGVITPLLTKSYKMMEKLVDKSEKVIDDMFNEDI